MSFQVWAWGCTDKAGEPNWLSRKTLQLNAICSEEKSTDTEKKRWSKQKTVEELNVQTCAAPVSDSKLVLSHSHGLHLVYVVGWDGMDGGQGLTLASAYAMYCLIQKRTVG